MKTNCNNTEYNNTEFSENESYQYLSEQEKGKGKDRIPHADWRHTG